MAIGYNGTPINVKNCFEGGCERCNKSASSGMDLDKCLCLHAEESAILEVGSRVAEGGTLYSTLFPCNWCAKVIVQCKIAKIIYSEEYGNGGGRKILESANIILRKLDFYFYDKI